MSFLNEEWIDPVEFACKCGRKHDIYNCWVDSDYADYFEFDCECGETTNFRVERVPEFYMERKNV